MQCLEQTTVKARKEHRCTWCHELIAPGDEYDRSKWVDGGDLWTQKAHPNCLILVQRYSRDLQLDEYDTVEWSEVLEWEAEATS